MIILKRFSDNKTKSGKLKLYDRFAIATRPFFKSESQMQDEIDAYQNNKPKNLARGLAARSPSVTGYFATEALVRNRAKSINKNPNSKLSKFYLKDVDRNKVVLGQMTREEFANKWYRKK